MINKKEIKKEILNILKNYKINKKQILIIYQQGAFNYNLETDKSDYDVFVVYKPTYKDYENDYIINKEITYSKGLIKIKDFKSFKKMLKRLNPSTLEIFFLTKFSILFSKREVKNYLNKNKYNFFFNLNKEIFYKAIYGMAEQKYVGLTKPFESKIPLIEKYGYDPKQFHHIIRLKDFAYKSKKLIEKRKMINPYWINNGPFKNRLINIKLEKDLPSLENVLRESKQAINDIRIMLNIKKKEKKWKK